MTEANEPQEPQEREDIRKRIVLVHSAFGLAEPIVDLLDPGDVTGWDLGRDGALILNYERSPVRVVAAGRWHDVRAVYPWQVEALMDEWARLWQDQRRAEREADLPQPDPTTDGHSAFDEEDYEVPSPSPLKAQWLVRFVRFDAGDTDRLVHYPEGVLASHVSEVQAYVKDRAEEIWAAEIRSGKRLYLSWDIDRHDAIEALATISIVSQPSDRIDMVGKVTVEQAS
jgi:hypothetical protein